MVATDTATRGLSTSDLEHIRDSLAGGRKPKVVFTESAGQMSGQVGQVVTLTDPQLSEEWVVVRFGRDELPFSPADLAVAPKTAAVRRTEPKTEVKSTIEPKVDVRKTAEPEPKNATVPAPRAAAAEAPSASTVDSVSQPARPAPPRKAAKPKASPGLTVTLAYAEGEWTVGAQQGAKALAKPYVIKPTDALRMVGLIDVPGVHDAVEEIVATARAQAEHEAQRLRAQLAEVEARLVELQVDEQTAGSNGQAGS
jgi:hypothetical protein